MDGAAGCGEGAVFEGVGGEFVNGHGHDGGDARGEEEVVAFDDDVGGVSAAEWFERVLDKGEEAGALPVGVGEGAVGAGEGPEAAEEGVKIEEID